MPNIPQIISQLNLLRNGDFSHYVDATTSPAGSGSVVFPLLTAHWRSLSNTTTVIPATVIVPDDPHRFLRIAKSDTIEQDVIDQSFFVKPSLREFTGTSTGVTVGATKIITISMSAAAFEVSEPSPSPGTTPPVVRTQPGDEIQLVNISAPASSGTYRVVAYNSSTSVDIVAKAGTDPATFGIANSVRILRKLDVFLVDLTVVFSVPTAQTADAIEPVAHIIRELPMPETDIPPVTIVTGAPVEYDEVTLSAGAVAKQIVCRLTNIEFIRSPRGLRLSLENTIGSTSDIADVGLYVGNYHLPVSTVSPAARGNVVTPLIPGPDHIHLLTGKGDLILMRAGSTAPEGYKKLKEELAFQRVSAVTITYDAGSDTSEVTIPGWAVPADELSGTYEIVFTDAAPAAPAKPGPLDVSVRMSDIAFNFVGGAQIDLTGILGTETVIFNTGGSPPFPVTLTEGTEFGAGIPTAGTTVAESLAIAINTDVNLGPIMTASASGAVVQVVTNAAYTNDADLLTDFGLLGETVTGATWVELNTATTTTQFRTVKSAVFSAPGDLSPRSGDAVFVVATAPLLATPAANAGDFRKPTKEGFGAIEGTSSTIMEIDTDGVAVNDIITFVDEDGDPLAPFFGQGPVYRVTLVDLAEGEVTVVDIGGGTTNIGPYTVDPANRYIVEKASGNHTHYAQQANLEERTLEAGGANSNTARGSHGHQMYEDDTIPQYRKFIICEKL